MTYRIRKEATTQMKLKIYDVSYRCDKIKTQTKTNKRLEARNKDRPTMKLKYKYKSLICILESVKVNDKTQNF